MTDTKDDDTEVEVLALPKAGKRRRFTLEQKQRVLADCDVPGMSVSEVARRHGISPSLQFRWRQMHEAGGLEGLGAEEHVVPESEYRQLQNRVRELERLLGKKTMETEILKDALEVARTKNSYCADADERGQTRDIRDCAIARCLAFKLARETSEARDDARCRHVERRRARL